MTDSTTVAQPIAQQLVQTLGVDLGDWKSSYCLVACLGEILDEGGVLTTKESLAALFQTMPSCGVLR